MTIGCSARKVSPTTGSGFRGFQGQTQIYQEDVVKSDYESDEEIIVDDDSDHVVKKPSEEFSASMWNKLTEDSWKPRNSAYSSPVLEHKHDNFTKKLVIWKPWSDVSVPDENKTQLTHKLPGIPESELRKSTAEMPVRRLFNEDGDTGSKVGIDVHSVKGSRSSRQEDRMEAPPTSKRKRNHSPTRPPGKDVAGSSDLASPINSTNSTYEAMTQVSLPPNHPFCNLTQSLPKKKRARYAAAITQHSAIPPLTERMSTSQKHPHYSASPDSSFLAALPQRVLCTAQVCSSLSQPNNHLDLRHETKAVAANAYTMDTERKLMLMPSYLGFNPALLPHGLYYRFMAPPFVPVTPYGAPVVYQPHLQSVASSTRKQ